MANLLNDYRQKQEEIRGQISEGGFPSNSLLPMQELHYRIFVLETLQSFCKSAPVTMDLQEISIHYQVTHVISPGGPRDFPWGPRYFPWGPT